MVLRVVKAKMQTLVFGNNKPQRGFTLLEVMLVLVIGGLLMGVVATSLSEGPVLRNASREVAAGLRHARAVAVVQQQPVVWKMSIKAHDFWLESTGNKDAPHAFHHGVEAKINTTASEVESAELAGVRFYPDGCSTGGSVELTYNKQTFKVNVEWVTGRVSIQ